MTYDEQIELAHMVSQAFDLRCGPYLRDAVDAIIDWHSRRAEREHERQLRSRAAVLAVLRETDPARGRRDHAREDRHDVADGQRVA